MNPTVKMLEEKREAAEVEAQSVEDYIEHLDQSETTANRKMALETVQLMFRRNIVTISEAIHQARY